MGAITSWPQVGAGAPPRSGAAPLVAWMPVPAGALSLTSDQRRATIWCRGDSNAGNFIDGHGGWVAAGIVGIGRAGPWPDTTNPLTKTRLGAVRAGERTNLRWPRPILAGVCPGLRRKLHRPDLHGRHRSAWRAQRSESDFPSPLPAPPPPSLPPSLHISSLASRTRTSLTTRRPKRPGTVTGSGNHDSLLVRASSCDPYADPPARMVVRRTPGAAVPLRRNKKHAATGAGDRAFPGQRMIM